MFPLTWLYNSLCVRNVLFRFLIFIRSIKWCRIRNWIVFTFSETHFENSAENIFFFQLRDHSTQIRMIQIWIWVRRSVFLPLALIGKFSRFWLTARTIGAGKIVPFKIENFFLNFCGNWPKVFTFLRWQKGLGCAHEQVPLPEPLYEVPARLKVLRGEEEGVGERERKGEEIERVIDEEKIR